MSKIAEIQQFLNHEVATILHLDEAAVNEDSSLDALGIHSMAFVELLIAIEKKFGVQMIKAGITRADMNRLGTLANRIEKAL